MIKTETHLHTSISSSCGRVTPDMIDDLYSKAGYGAIIVTDHYNYKVYEKYNKTVEQWLKGYEMLRDECKHCGIKVFLGMELRFDGTKEDYLVYGFDEDFLIKNQQIYKLTLPEAYKILDGEGYLIYQAHPCRDEHKPSDPAFLHGIEVYNGSVRHENHNDEALAYANEHGLLHMSGSDFHFDYEVGTGGMYIDEGIETEKELAQFLKSCGHGLKLYYGEFENGNEPYT